MKTRAIEMYIGIGTDFGTWSTEYVDIPIDTPDDKIEEVAIAKVKEDGVVDNFVFCGVYCIPSLDDQPYGDDYDTDDEGNCIYCGQKCCDGEMCDEQQAGGF